MSGTKKNEWELTDEEIARATSLLNAQFAKERKQNTSLLDRGMFGTQSDVNRRAYDAASMSYDDFLQGDTYEELAKRYSDKGKMAMDDTIGKVAARTGGIASSYATQAGQQAYGDWMTRLEETARAMYDSERQEAMDRYALSKDVLDMRNSAEDRRLALEDRLRAQKYEDEDRQIKAEDRTASQKDDLKTDIYNAAYAGKISWPQFAERANALGLTKADFMSIVKQAEQKREDDLYDRNADETRYNAEDARSQILDIINATVADADGIYNYNIPQSLIDASGLDPLTINAWKMGNEQGVVPKTLDFNADQVLEQLQGGNINANTLKTYEETYGESYPSMLVRTGNYRKLTLEDLDKIRSLLGTEANTDQEIASVADLMGKWYEYYGKLADSEKGTEATDGIGKLTDREWFVTADGKFRDAAGYRTYTEDELITALIADGLSKKEAKKWIEENKDFWTYAS